MPSSTTTCHYKLFGFIKTLEVLENIVTYKLDGDETQKDRLNHLIETKGEIDVHDNCHGRDKGFEKILIDARIAFTWVHDATITTDQDMGSSHPVLGEISSPFPSIKEPSVTLTELKTALKEGNDTKAIIERLIKHKERLVERITGGNFPALEINSEAQWDLEEKLYKI